MLVLVRHVAPLECTQSAGGVLNFVVGTVYSEALVTAVFHKILINSKNNKLGS